MARKLISVLIFLSMLSMAYIEGNDVGRDVKASGEEFIPVKKVTFVKFDENSYMDDYAYLAAIPASIFRHDGKTYAYPLLFYDDFKPSNKHELSLNSSQGIKYFMEDWIAYCRGLDKIECINMGKPDFEAKNYSYINSTDIYEIASKIALKHWKKSDVCFVAYAGDFDEYESMKGDFSASIEGKVKRMEIMLPEPEGIGGVYADFDVPPPYVYIEASVEWNPLLRGHDIDLQLYDNAFGMVDASENWNALFGTHEAVSSYIFNYGKWKVGLTNMPTEDLNDFIESEPKRYYEVNISLYSGGVYELPSIEFKARNVSIDVRCSENISFGVALISNGIPYEPYYGNGNISISIPELGTGNYSICIFLKNETNANFDVRYEWQNVGSMQTHSFAAASQAAVLASLMDAPLLYISPDGVPKPTKNAMERLGVKKVIGIGLENNPFNGYEFENYGVEESYQKIMETSGKNVIVFTTTSPWTYWLTEELKPHGDKERALYIGPAAYMAAFHEVPSLIVDEHEPLSNSASWITDFWRRDSLAREPPPPGCMYLMASQVYNFLASHGYEREGNEDIITIAGQFDIGIGWDRAFVGKANPGRILGTPADASYWVARSVFYPAMIFVNPALKGNVELINGSISQRGFAGRFKIIKPSMKENFSYPVLNTWVSYCHEFNKEASKYWGCKYTTRDGITPYDTPSPNPIDEGVTDKIGAYWPDISTSEVTPFYLKKLGYSVAFSTNFSATMDNLNQGVIMWFEGMHAGHGNSGGVGFWDPNANWSKMMYMLKDVPIIWKIIENKKITTEPNPWRGYEFGLLRQALFRWGMAGKQTQIFQTGCTENPDVMVMDKWFGWDLHSALHPDGVVIAIFQQVETEIKNGYDFDEALKNLHSCGINAGISCYISSTYLHLTMIRHGSVFQIIDPWLTSWYANFAVEMFARYLALGYSAGEAYSKSMEHVGIGYLTKEWWWDVSENICYFGDPTLHVWSPAYSWNMPLAINAGTIGEHVT